MDLSGKSTEELLSMLGGATNYTHAPEPVDPTEGMSGFQKFAAGAGKSVYDLGRGIKQIFSGNSPSMSGLVSGDNRNPAQQSVDESRQLDAPLMKTGAGVAGDIAGNTAMFAPTAFIPGANTYTGSALGGAVMGALQPTAGGESRTSNALLGGVMGLAGQAVGNAVGRAIRPITSRLSPEAEALAQAAQREGIPLTAGQKTGSRPLQIAESVMENLPLTSASQIAGREAQQRAFTAAALKRGGMVGDAATPELLGTQRAALGNTLQDIASANTLNFNGKLMDDLSGIAQKAAVRGKTAAEPVHSIIDNILNEVGQGGVMGGKNYQAWRQTLRPLASGGGENAHLYGEIRRALDNAFNAQMANSQPWTQANRQYANLKTLMNAAGGPGVSAATNQIAPTQLASALRQSIGKEGVSLGRGDLNELSRVGQTFVRDNVPNSGTAQRQLIQNLLTSGGGVLGGAGIGGGTAMAMGKDPLQGAAYGAGIGGAALAAPRLAQILMNSPAGQKYLTKGAVALTDAQRRALVDALRTASIGSVPALSQ